MVPLQRALEADRYGFVAHALAVREGCTSIACNALKLLPYASQVRANLGAETFDRYVDRYQAVWAQPPSVPVAEAPAPQPAAVLTGGLGPRKMVNIDFPTAASIPPISIMNPEPGVKGPPSVAAAAGGANAAAGKAGGPPRPGHAARASRRPIRPSLPRRIRSTSRPSRHRPYRLPHRQQRRRRQALRRCSLIRSRRCPKQAGTGGARAVIQFA